MKRVMVNLDDETGELLEAQAARDKRSISAYVGKLVEIDLRSSGLLPGNEVARSALLATAEEIGVEDAIKLIDREARKRRKSSHAHRSRRHP